MKARHLPTVVDYVPWNDRDEDRDALRQLGYGEFHYADDGAPDGARTLLVPTNERRPAEATPGEYQIVKGTQGEFYPVHYSVFTACYERLDDREQLS